MATTISFEELTGCQAALFEWVESYDTKDFERLRKCIAPTLRVRIIGELRAKRGKCSSEKQIDYRSFLNKLWENMDAEQYVPMASDPHFLGNPLLKTQHFVGGVSRWEKTGDDEIIGHHQLRVAHQRYTDNTFTKVAVKGHAHGGATMWYKKVDGVWKFAGVCPETRWFEYDYDKVFTDAAAHLEQ